MREKGRDEMGRFLILILLLTGCMVGPNYRRPFLDIPESYAYEIEEAKATLNTEWWLQFLDPML
jgi:multidrug efflux system outer membrane protein